MASVAKQAIEINQHLRRALSALQSTNAELTQQSIELIDRQKIAIALYSQAVLNPHDFSQSKIAERSADLGNVTDRLTAVNQDIEKVNQQIQALYSLDRLCGAIEDEDEENDRLGFAFPDIAQQSEGR